MSGTIRTGEDDMALRIALFGPFLATEADAVLPARGDIPRAALSRLALSPGEVLTAEQLIDDLWVDPPATVLSSLRAHISRLRSGGWGAYLGGGRRGYSLDIDPDAVDVLQYRRLVAGDGGARIDELTAAERLWRGAPLGGSISFPFAAPVVESLGEARRSAVLELGRLHLDRGDHAMVPLAVAPLLDEHPFDEELVALHAQALARSGRTGDALDVLDAFRSRLADERGLEPGEALGDLRQSIVRQDPVVVAAALGDAPPVERVGVPIPLTRFIGRAPELELIERGRAESRLLTVIGPAGVGKTRLAIEAARRVTSAIDDEQWLVDLAVVSDAGRVIPAIADVIGAMEHTAAQLAERLRGRRALLILDNAEHVLGAVAAVVTDLLSRCEGLTVLVTSREALRMAGERVIAIEPFVGDAAPDAVRLFLQRATDTAGITDWDDAELATISRLCASLDGLPLALELAAARLDILSLPEVAESLGRPSTLVGGRHDSIDDALAWSIALLSVAELSALRQLALFAGSFSLDAVAAVVRVDGSDPRELATALARKSLVAAVASETGVRRFRLLESVQQHLRAHHPEPAADEWEERRTAWAVELVATTARAIRGPDTRRARAVLAESRPDLDAALESAIAGGDRATALRIAGPQAWHWYERSLHADARHFLDRVLAMPGDSLPEHEAAAHLALAFIAAVGPDPMATVQAMERMSEAAFRTDDDYLRMMALTAQGYLLAVSGQTESADELLAQAAAIRDASTTLTDWDLGDEILLRGDALRALGRHAQALEYLAGGYRLGTDTGNVFAVKGASYVTGKVLVELRRGREALPVARIGAIRSLESEDWASAVSAINVSATALCQLERHAEAAELFAAVEKLGRRFGFSTNGVDQGYSARYLTATRAALTGAEWDAAVALGETHSMKSVMQRLAELS